MMDGDFPLDDFAGLDHIMMPDYDKLGGGPTTPSNLSPGDMTSLNNNDDSSSLTFQLLTNEDHGGYLVAVSQERVALLRQLVTESGLYNMEPSQVCTRFLEHADKATKTLTKDRYDCAIRSIVASSVGPKALTSETQQNLSSVLTSVFYAFDKGKTQRVDAIACKSSDMSCCNHVSYPSLSYPRLC